MEVADAMVSNGLRDAGYVYINLDDGWAVNRSADGQMIADPALFPPSAPGRNDGIKLVADYIHKQKLMFGIYTARGSVTCLGRPGSDAHELVDASLWASWGVSQAAAAAATTTWSARGCCCCFCCCWWWWWWLTG